MAHPRLRIPLWYIHLFLLLFSCTKEDTYPWRDSEVYTHELSGSFYKRWKMTFMTSYYSYKGKPEISIHQKQFGDGNTVEFYADGTLRLGDSICIRTFLPATTTWEKLESREPSKWFFIGGQLWPFQRYYPQSAFDIEKIIFWTDIYYVNNDRRVFYEMSFEQDWR